MRLAIIALVLATCTQAQAAREFDDKPDMVTIKSDKVAEIAAMRKLWAMYRGGLSVILGDNELRAHLELRHVDDEGY